MTEPVGRTPPPRWRLRRPGITRPLQTRDFALLWTGTAVSLVGDGITNVALAWQVLNLSNAPTALAIVGVAWTAPHVAFLLFGGVLSDRFDRRGVLIAADVVRGLMIGTAGVLSVTGALELWHLLILMAVYGVGNALFGPSFEAIIPDLVSGQDLVQANSLFSLLRPIGLRLIGPALGGLLVAAVGSGAALLVDSATFGLSAGALVLMRRLPRPTQEMTDLSFGSAFREIREGFAYVRSQAWLWATIVAAGIAQLAFQGPLQALVPFLARNELRVGARGLGLVFAAQGVGGLLGALAMGARRLPKRHVTTMYLLWTVGMLGVIGLGLARNLWQAMAAGFIGGVGITTGSIIWATLMQTLVPRNLLGRATSLDWLVSISLTPVSFAIAGPLGEAIGARATLVSGGIIAAATLLFLFIPGVRDPERADRPEESRGADMAERGPNLARGKDS
jgi:MFS family permease